MAVLAVFLYLLVYSAFPASLSMLSNWIMSVFSDCNTFVRVVQIFSSLAGVLNIC